MPMTSSERRNLAAHGQRLKPKLTVAGQDVTATVAQHVRRAFEHEELIKIRVNTKDRGVCALVFGQLEQQVPCELVRAVGRVGLFYRAGARSGQEATGAADRASGSRDASNRRDGRFTGRGSGGTG